MLESLGRKGYRTLWLKVPCAEKFALIYCLAAPVRYSTVQHSTVQYSKIGLGELRLGKEYSIV